MSWDIWMESSTDKALRGCVARGIFSPLYMEVPPLKMRTSDYIKDIIA